MDIVVRTSARIPPGAHSGACRYAKRSAISNARGIHSNRPTIGCRVDPARARGQRIAAMTAEARPARRLSSHPEAVKARRWRGRKAAERRGAVLVAVIVEPGEIRELRRLGLLAGGRW